MTRLLVVLLLLLGLCGCTFVVPGNPPRRWCYPAKSWRCHPDIVIGLV